jgi:hypothetical protein
MHQSLRMSGGIQIKTAVHGHTIEFGLEAMHPSCQAEKPSSTLDAWLGVNNLRQNLMAEWNCWHQWIHTAWIPESRSLCYSNPMAVARQDPMFA